MLKILHTSDLQLDAPFLFLGTKGKDYRQRLRRALEKITSLAAEKRYDLLMIAGDLFNSNSPSQDTIHFVNRNLGSLGIPVIILPGNHDCYDSQSVYRRHSFPDNVHIIRDRESYLPFAELDLTVAGSPIVSPYDNQPLIKGLTREKVITRWYVIAAHGSLQLPGKSENNARTISLNEIASSGADYVALGDWHSFANYSQGQVKAFYSGAPEPTSLTQTGAGKIASVTLSEQGTVITPIPVGVTTVQHVPLSISGLSAEQIIARIKQKAAPDVMLTVTLTGLKRLEELIDLEAIHEALSSDFYYLQVKDESVTALEHISAADYPETHVIGQYIHLLQREIEVAKSEEDRRVAEQAMQLGVLLLQGKEVLK